MNHFSAVVVVCRQWIEKSIAQMSCRKIASNAKATNHVAR